MAFDLGKEISTQVKTRVFKKVVGGVGDFIRGIPSIGNSSELGKLATRQKSNVDHLSFPLDVASDTSTGNHGHYIIFYIKFICKKRSFRLIKPIYFFFMFCKSFTCLSKNSLTIWITSNF